jgi:hypothetical protein
MSSCIQCGRYTDDCEYCAICRDLMCRCCGSEYYDSPPPESDIVCDCDTGNCISCNEICNNHAQVLE